MNTADRRYRVLVIEDNPGDRLIVREYLGEHMANHEIVEAKSFSKGKEFLKNREDNFDVVLLDLTLPDVTKQGLMAYLQTEVLDTPVIILTGYADLDFAVKSMAVGVSDYLLKDTISSLVLYKSILYSIERKNFLKSLKASEKKYMDIFHLSPEPMWVFDTNTLRFLDVNESAERRYGYTAEEFLQMTVRDIRPPQDIAVFDAVYHNSLVQERGGKAVKGPHRHRRKNGEIIFVDIHYNSIEFKGTKAMIILATDVTRHVEYLKAIEAQNETLRKIAWIQSHQVRAPVARLMSIVEMIRTSEMSISAEKKLLEGILSSAREIDEYTAEINGLSYEVGRKDTAKS